MTREEVEKSREYHIHKTAAEWYKNHNDDNVFDFFEAGYNQGYKDAVDKACEWMNEFLWSSKPFYQLIEDFKRAMNEQQ